MDIQLSAVHNILDGTASLLNLIMPETDMDGNPLSDGITCGVSFGGAITTLTFTGPMQFTAPSSASAGQVINFRYSVNTSSWWYA